MNAQPLRHPDTPADRDVSAEIEAEIRRQVLAERQAAVSAGSSAIEDEIRRQMIAERQGARPLSKPSAPNAAARAKQGTLARWKGRGGILGVIATVIAWIAKLNGLLVALKFFGIIKTVLLTGGTMFLSMGAYALFYGWRFSAALVATIFLHECGHVIAVRLKGRPFGVMMFVPLMGAFVSFRGVTDPVEHAFIAIAGPIAGGLAAAAAGALYLLTGDAFWLMVANWTFVLNAVNLLPISPLDGSRVAPILSGPPAAIHPSVRRAYRIAYFGLIALLAIGAYATRGHLPSMRPSPGAGQLPSDR